MHVLLCEDSIDGIFTGVYQAYASRLGHKNIRLATPDSVDTYELFCTYEEIPVDYTLSQKVARTLIDRLGSEAYEILCQAISAQELRLPPPVTNKADAVYHTIVLALHSPQGNQVFNALQNPWVNSVFLLSRAASNEAQHLLGFLRFQELEQHILFSRVHPKNHILPLLAHHFTDRLPQEHFIIFDQNRSLAAVHQAGRSYFITEVSQENLDFMSRLSQEELAYQQLWLEFFHSIAIQARENPKLQQQNIPKRFWPDALELSEGLGESRSSRLLSQSRNSTADGITESRELLQSQSLSSDCRG